MALLGKYKNINLKENSEDPKYVVKVYDHRERTLPLGEKFVEWHREQRKLLDQAEYGNFRGTPAKEHIDGIAIDSTKKLLERQLSNDKSVLKNTAVQTAILAAFAGVGLVTSTNQFLETQSQEALLAALSSGALETFLIAMDASVVQRIRNSIKGLKKVDEIMDEKTIGEER